VTLHRRSEWVEAAYPVTGPAFDASRVEFIVVHYGAVPWSEERLRDSVRYWRDTQRYYQNDRGYSIGYQWGVDRIKGDVWELRGFDFRNAANGTLSASSPYHDQLAPSANVRTVSIHVILPMSGEYLTHQLDGCRDAVAMIRERLGRKVPVIPHSDVNATSCPGDPLRRAIAQGLLEPTPTPPKPNPPMPPEVLMFDQVYDYVTCADSRTPAIYAQLRSNQKVWLHSPEAWDAHKRLAKANGYSFALRRYSIDEFRALGPIVGPRPRRVDEWGI
jgi:hypothetical protein